MAFIRYPHLERFGNVEVDDIQFGTCHIFPKIDGTNGSIWSHNGELKFGSRNRILSVGNDNQGFMTSMIGDARLPKFFDAYPRWRLYGEWLVPHTLKDYKDDAWKKFYIFDVFDDEIQQFVAYEEYKPALDRFELDYIPCFWKAKNVDEATLSHYARECRYLLKPEAVYGEGIVIKNYNWINKYGRQTWAKWVNADFKTEHVKQMGPVEHKFSSTEEKLVDLAITPALVEKEYSKIVVDNGGWSSKYIPRLLETVFYCLVAEELWSALKKLNFPTVSFRVLRSYCINKVKTLKPELF